MFLLIHSFVILEIFAYIVHLKQQTRSSDWWRPWASAGARIDVSTRVSSPSQTQHVWQLLDSQLSHCCNPGVCLWTTFTTNWTLIQTFKANTSDRVVINHFSSVAITAAPVSKCYVPVWNSLLFNVICVDKRFSRELPVGKSSLASTENVNNW